MSSRRRIRARRVADPTFSADQVVSTTDVIRHWKTAVESKLPDREFLVMFSGSRPKAAIVDFDKFSALWHRAQALEDSLLRMEATERILRARASGKPLTSLRELIEKAGLTEEDLENIPDVEITPG